MHNSKLIQLLATLSMAEMARFDKYVHSPYFTVHEDTIRLFDYLNAPEADFSEAYLQPERVFEALYPGKPYNDGRLRTLRKYLLKLLMGFLGQLEYEADEEEMEIHQLRGLYKKGIDKYFIKQLDVVHDQLDSYPYLNADYYRYRFQVAQLKIDHQITRESRWEQKEQTEALEHLDHFYLIEKLKYASSWIMQLKVFTSEDAFPPLLKDILAYCEAYLESLPKVVQVYVNLIHLAIQDDARDPYRNLRRLLGELAQQSERKDLVNIYNYLINHCNQRYRAGDASFLKEIFSLYQEMIELDLLSDEAMQSSHHYKNVTTVGLRLGEYEWTEKFIHTFKDQIDEAYREGVYHYNLAHLYAYKNEYSQALQHLQRVSFIDPFYRISYNVLLLKIYYECEEIEPFFALATSFQTFMRRKKALTERQRESYLNFIRFAKGLFQVQIGQKRSLGKLPQDLTSCEALVELEWLTQKLESLS